MPVSSHDLALGIALLARRCPEADDLHRMVCDWLETPAGSLGELLVHRGRLPALELVRAEEAAERLLERGTATHELSRSCCPETEPSLPLFDASQPTAHPQTGDGLSLEARADSLPATARYRVLHRHASGGLGEVFVAHDEELGRDVALKRIREEYAGFPELRARFLLEAEITGMVEHPGIVPVYGRGHDAQNRPFYAMRFVQGETLQQAIVRFHATHRARLDQGGAALELRRLLRHFVDVCNALACVHDRGAIHRDLKPANIMLGPYGETFVVDWGLAKIVGRAEAAASLPDTAPAETQTLRPASAGSAGGTAVGTAIGTPAYMSPEQAAGLVDELRSSSDLYGLGAILYTILSGRPPVTGNDPETMRQDVLMRRFPRPREVQPGAPAPLEAVCLKAMSLDPQQRYASARELATEIEAWMADEPVRAWREPFRLRAARWVRRHRAAVVGAAAALVVTIISLSVGMVMLAAVNEQVRRSESIARAREEDARWNFQLARSAVDRYLTQISQDERLKQQDLEPLRRDLLQIASGFYEQFTRQQPEDPDLLAAWGWSHDRLANITAEIGSKREAIAMTTRAVDTFAALAERFPDNSGYHEACLRAMVHRARLLLDTGEPLLAAAELKTTHARAASLLQQRPDLDGVGEAMAECCVQLARAAREGRDNALAEKALQEALDLRRRLNAATPGVESLQSALAGNLAALADVYCQTQRYPEASALLIEAATLQQRLVDEHRHSATYLSGLAGMCDQLADLYNRWSASSSQTEQALLAALRVRQRLAREHPAVTEYQSRLATSQHTLARFYLGASRPADAEQALLASRQLYEPLVEMYAEVPEYALELAAVDRQLSTVAGGQDRHGEAVRYAKEAVDALRALADRFPKRADFACRLADASRGLGDAQLAAGQADDAQNAYAATIDALDAAASVAGPVSVAEVARAIASQSGCDGPTYYRAALLLARAAHETLEEAASPVNQPEKASALSSADCAVAAMQSLDKAAAAGYFGDPFRRKQLREEEAFDALRVNEAYRDKIEAIALP